MRRVRLGGARRAIASPFGLRVAACATLLACASATITHVLATPAGTSNSTFDPTAIPVGAETRDIVLVRADDRRLVGEAADGTFVTFELPRRDRAQLSAAAHEFMHGSSAAVVRVAFRRAGDARWAVAVAPGPRHFPGVTRAAPRPMAGTLFASFAPGVTREEVLEAAGPPHVPGFGQSWEGRPADCFEWRAAGTGGNYRLCFDQSSAPRLLGRSSPD